jgi:hypothetical protein
VEREEAVIDGVVVRGAGPDLGDVLEDLPAVWTTPFSSVNWRTGSHSSRRTMSAAIPPRKNMKSVANRYMIPIFLWSIVVAQFRMSAHSEPLLAR